MVLKKKRWFWSHCTASQDVLKHWEMGKDESSISVVNMVLDSQTEMQWKGTTVDFMSGRDGAENTG